MKGIIFKDIISSKKMLALYLAMIAVFSLGGTNTLMFAMIYTLMIPVNMCSLDERSRFERLMPALPLTGMQAVADKYIVTYAGAALMVLLSVCVTSVRAGALAIPQDILPALSIMLVTQAVCIPAIIRLGVLKARIAYLGAVIVEGVAAGLMGGMSGVSMWSRLNSPVVVAAALLLNVVSLFVSAKMFDLRAEQ